MDVQPITSMNFQSMHHKYIVFGLIVALDQLTWTLVFQFNLHDFTFAFWMSVSTYVILCPCKFMSSWSYVGWSLRELVFSFRGYLYLKSTFNMYVVFFCDLHKKGWYWECNLLIRYYIAYAMLNQENRSRVIFYHKIVAAFTALFWI